MALLSTKYSINEVNQEKVFAAKQAVSATSAAVNLSSTAMPLGGSSDKVCRTSGINQPMIVLQGTEDFWYSFGTSGSGAVTTAAGATPGIFVRAGDQEYVRPAAQPGRFYLYLIRDSADGTVVISVVRNSA